MTVKTRVSTTKFNNCDEKNDRNQLNLSKDDENQCNLNKIEQIQLTNALNNLYQEENCETNRTTTKR